MLHNSKSQLQCSNTIKNYCYKKGGDSTFYCCINVQQLSLTVTVHTLQSSNHCNSYTALSLPYWCKHKHPCSTNRKRNQLYTTFCQNVLTRDKLHAITKEVCLTADVHFRNVRQSVYCHTAFYIKENKNLMSTICLSQASRSCFRVFLS